MHFSRRDASLVTNYVRSSRPLPRCLNYSKRCLQISTFPSESRDIRPPETSDTERLDSTFNIIGGSFSLLSVSLSASQNLYTRSGTLVGIAGKAENTVSTLSILEPFSRTFLRIPFLYQRITSTTPVTALVSTKSMNTSVTAIYLDGSKDWMLARQSLLAWTGRTLSVKPTADFKMSAVHWGRSEVTGRGVMALVGHGSVSEINLKAEESYVIHPSNVIAYTKNSHPPLPYRFKSWSFRLRIPDIPTWLPDIKFFRDIRKSATWQNISRLAFVIRTWSQKIIWGDRLFLQFHGPTTILLQTRAPRIGDSLAYPYVSEAADMRSSATQPSPTLSKLDTVRESSEKPITDMGRATATGLKMQIASMGRDGKVSFKPTSDLAPLG